MRASAVCTQGVETAVVTLLELVGPSDDGLDKMVVRVDQGACNLQDAWQLALLIACLRDCSHCGYNT